jgi:hypothetical protein
VYIGDTSSPINISRDIQEYSPITTTALDIVGFEKTEQEITVHNVSGIDLDTRFNTRWSRSNKVTIEVRNLANTAWILHRTLRILEAVYNDGRKPEGSTSPSLKIKIGCKIALLDSNYQSQASYKIPALSTTNYVSFRTLLTYWLSYFKFPALSLVSGDYSGNPNVYFDLPYTPGQSAAEHIGRFVYAYTGAYWWIDANENSRLHKPTLTPTIADFTYDGRDCAINGRSQNEREKPAGLVRVFGVSNQVSAYVDPPPTTTSVTTANLTEVSTFRVTTLPLTRTTEKEGTQTISGVSLSASATSGGSSGGSAAGSASLGNIGSFKETTVEEYTGGFLSQPNPIAGQPDIPGSPAWLNKVTVSIEEQRSTTSGATASIGLGTRSKTKEIITDYYYLFTSTAVQGVTVQGVEVRKIVTTTKILRESSSGGSVTGSLGGGSGSASGSFASNADVDEITTEEWIKLAEGIYKYNKTTVRPNDIENRRDLNAGNAAQNSPPPATQFAPTRILTNPVELFGKSTFQYPPLAPDNNHPRDFNLNFYLPSNTRAKEIALYEGSLIIGRTETQDLAFKPTDAWYADPKPAPVVFIHQDTNSTTDDVYLLDSASVLFGLRQQYVFGSGIWLGIRDRITGVITAPYLIQQTYLTTESGDRLTDQQGNRLFQD